MYRINKDEFLTSENYDKMKRYLTILQRMAFVAVMMMCVVTVNAADKEYCAVYNETNKTVTFMDADYVSQSYGGTMAYFRLRHCLDPSYLGIDRLVPFSSEVAESVEKAVFHQSFTTAHFVNIKYMFEGWTNLKEIEGLEYFDMSQVVVASGAFFNCKSLISLDLSSKDMSSLKDAENMFYLCSDLKTLKMASTSSQLLKMNYMFHGCSSLVDLDVSRMVTSGVSSFLDLFYQCSSLTELDLSSFDTSKVTNMDNMFNGCTKLKKVYLQSFNTSKVGMMQSMFRGCKALESIIVGSEWTVANVTEDIYMFSGCVKIVGGSGTTYSNEHVGKDYAHIDGGTGNPGYLRRLIYYDLWLGGVQVDELNQDGITFGSGYAQYKPNNKLLFLNNATIDASNAGIKNGSNLSNGIDGLTIQIRGNCTIKSNANPMILYGNTTIEDWRDTENKLVMEGANSINVYKTLTFNNKKTRATIANGSLFSGPTTSSALVFDNGASFGGLCSGKVVNNMSSITLGSGLEYAFLYDGSPISFNSSEHTLYMGGSPLKDILMIGEYYPLWIAGYHMSSAWELTPLLSDLMPVQISSEDVYSMKKLTLTGTIPSYSNNSRLSCTAPFLDIIVTDAFYFVTEEEDEPAFDYQGRGQCTITGTGTLVINSKNGPAVKADDGSSLEIKDVDFSVQGKTGGFKDVKTLYFTNAEGTATCESGYVVSNVDNFFISRCYINNNVSFDRNNKRIASNVLKIGREKNVISTDIDQVTSNKYQVTSDDWYTIDGRKLSGKPAKKGIYIHNGKKVLK